MPLNLRDRTGWTTGMLQLHKQGWIAWQMAQSMDNGNSISRVPSTTRPEGKAKLWTPSGRWLTFPLFMPCTVSWEKKKKKSSELGYFFFPSSFLSFYFSFFFLSSFLLKNKFHFHKQQTATSWRRSLLCIVMWHLQ